MLLRLPHLASLEFRFWRGCGKWKLTGSLRPATWLAGRSNGDVWIGQTQVSAKGIGRLIGCALVYIHENGELYATE